MTTDPILDELHETRGELLAGAGGTLEGLIAALRKRQQESGRRILPAEGTSLLDAPGVETGVTADEIVAAVRESRERGSNGGSG